MPRPPRRAESAIVFTVSRPRAFVGLIVVLALSVMSCRQPTLIPPVQDAQGDRCRVHGISERVEIARGETAVVQSKLAVTYVGSMHDNYEDGTTDEILEFRFQSISETGELSPSALTWMPSAFAPPQFHHLAINRCVKLVAPGRERVILEIASVH
jgi:hypothetical protein